MNRNFAVHKNQNKKLKEMMKLSKWMHFDPNTDKNMNNN